MSQFMVVLIAVFLAFVNASGSRADVILVVSGQSNLFLNPTQLNILGITIGATTGTVTPESGYTVAYPISARDATPNTTFSYDPTNFSGTFSGVIAHTGTVTFQSITTPFVMGNFTVGYDAFRVDATRSGFFIKDNVTLNAPLFDIAEADKTVQATATFLKLDGSLLLSVEAATGLGDASLEGLTMGKGFVDAISAVPEPSSILMLAGVGVVGSFFARRRKMAVA
jgi:hypothetical protein